MQFNKTLRMMTSLAAIGIASLALAPISRAAELDAATIAAAKKEGTVTWYTTLIVNQLVRPMINAFEKKYGIKVKYSRADGAGTTKKILTEARARNVHGDVFDNTQIRGLIEAGAIEKFSVPNLARMPKKYVDPSGYWVASAFFILTAGYNTELVKNPPKTYDDLLDPRFKGKMAWKPNGISGAPGFAGNLVEAWGKGKATAYLKQLAKQDVKVFSGSGRALLNQAVSGEFPVVLQIFNHHAVISAKKGAPVNWVALEPATNFLVIMGKMANSPHPNAAKVLMNYIVSEEGQKVFQAANYLPADPTLKAKTPRLKPEHGGFTATVITPQQLGSEVGKWTDIYKGIFRR